MSNVTPIETFEPVVLTAANLRVPFSFQGEFIHCLSADEAFLISVDNGTSTVELSSNRQFKMPLDDSGRQTRFQKFLVSRKSTAAVASNSVVLVVGSGEFRDGNSAYNLAVTVAAGQTIRDTAAGTLDASVADKAPVATGGANATALIAASTIALRKGVKVRNTGTVPLRVAGTDATAKSGTAGDYLGVGESCFYPVAGALYAAGVGGVGACSVVELLW